MRKLLLALPLFLVVGLLFVELPVGNSSPSNVSPTTSTPQASSVPVPNPSTESSNSTPSTPQNLAPSKPAKTKIDIGGGKKPKHSNDDESGEHEGFGEDDD